MKKVGISQSASSPMDADNDKLEAPDMNKKEKLQEKCSFTKLNANSKPLCPVKILCAHPSPPDQLLVHWKPTTALSVSGYEVIIPHTYIHRHKAKHVTCIKKTLLWLTPHFLPHRLTLTEFHQLKHIHKYAHLLFSMI